jgi:type IV fimbrial biogenesis protein FimT
MKVNRNYIALATLRGKCYKYQISCSTWALVMSPYSFQPCNQKKSSFKALSKGFSLIELMVVIAVSAIMITIAIPSLSDFTVKMRIDNEISQLNRLVLSARNSAITLEQNVITCPLESGVCTANWQNELTTFIDNDNNGTFLAANDTLVKIKAANTSGDVITYAGQISIGFTPAGILATAPSQFLYCPKSDKSLARAIVLSPSGRTYVTADANNDGKDEFRLGGNVVCP